MGDWLDDFVDLVIGVSMAVVSAGLALAVFCGFVILAWGILRWAWGS